jgi:hypothetical protein
MKKTAVPVLFACLFASVTLAQRPDSTRTSGSFRPLNAPRPYREVITDKAKTDEGLFKVHKVDEKWFFEIPDSLLGRDIMVVNRVTKSSINAPKTFGGYAGDQINESVIRFERGPNYKIYLKSVSFTTISKDSSQPMYQAVMNSNIQPIAAAFEIRAWAKDSAGSVIDVSDYLNSDNDVVAFASSSTTVPTSVVLGKSSFQVGALQSDKSYVATVRSYPMNIEIRSVKTYSKTAGASIGGGMTQPGSQSNITLEINNSFVLLPARPMQQRIFDSRIGFYSRSYADYDLNPQRVENTNMVIRWRLEPREEDRARYFAGELVEPKKPIIFYIDPATPRKWVPYLIQGVNDWQAAFEKAGFKNAIMAKEAPVNDPDWSLEDSRYSAIVYKPSPVENAYGPSVTDPRSGEILESHIGWFHNVMKLLQNWYFIQTAAVDPRARTMKLPDSLMGQLIRFVSSHEVGHTLGLAHNFGSSSTVPVEKLRDKAWVEANGHTPSIMDYARFNYVAQPEDNIGEKGLFPRIGDYDKWAIEWGYRVYPEYRTPEEEKVKLNEWVSQKMQNRRLWYGLQGNSDDPRSQNEDLGDDAMKAGTYGIKNLQRILPNLQQWTKEEGEDYSNLREMYNELVNQYSRYMGHVVKYVGGIMETPKSVSEQGAVYEFVPEVKQKEAIDFFAKQLFNTPSWIIDQGIYSKTGQNGLVIIGGIQDNILGKILNNRTLAKLLDAEAVLGSNAYQLTELFADLKKGIWSELPQRKAIDIYRRNLQKSYINSLNNLLNPSTGGMISIPGFITSSSVINDKSDIKSVVRAHLAGLRTEVNAAALVATDPMTKYHLQDLVKRIDNALNPKD